MFSVKTPSGASLSGSICDTLTTMTSLLNCDGSLQEVGEAEFLRVKEAFEGFSEFSTLRLPTSEGSVAPGLNIGGELGLVVAAQLEDASHVVKPFEDAWGLSTCVVSLAHGDSVAIWGTGEVWEDAGAFESFCDFAALHLGHIQVVLLLLG